MTLEISNGTAAAEHTTFNPTDHLLGILQHIVASQANTRIVLAGKGEMVVLPANDGYYITVDDIAEFCRTPAAQFEVLAFGTASLPFARSSGKTIKSLLWQAAFHASQGRLIEGCSKYDVVHFERWPNLTRLPTTPNTARICALLTRHPTTLMLVHRVLGIDKEEVLQIVSAASSAGISKTINLNPDLTNFEAEIANKPPESIKGHGLFRALFAKLSRL